MINTKLSFNPESLKTEKDLIQKYNEICIKHLKEQSILSNLSNNELFIWITGQTYKFGRSLKYSIENALSHMKDRKNAERLFGTKEVDLLSGW